ncbi:MAG: cation-transporting P-type ATPase [Rhodopila sp.]
MPPDQAATPPRQWHMLDAESVAAEVQTDPANGLRETTAHERRARFGPNAIREGQRRGKLRMLLSQFTDFMILLLIAAAVVSGVIGDAADTAIILGIVVLNGAVGFGQEFRAERAMAALKRLAAFDAIVVRDGWRQTVKADALVPGDLVLLEAGNAVPADLRLLEAFDLRLGEAALTGESLPIIKDTVPHPDPALGVADQTNREHAKSWGRSRGL